MSRETFANPMPPGTQPAWSVAPSREALQLIAEGVTRIAGFGIAAISVVREDGKLEVMAVAGSEAARDQLEGRRTPVEQLEVEIAKADDWGLLRFVPHERLDPSVGETWGWVPDIDPIDDGADAWHPLDLLLAPVYDDAGDLRGTLSIDLPVDGRRPGEAQRAVLSEYAEQAGRAVLITLEREALAEQVRMAQAARRIVRNASSQLTLDRLLAETRDALVEGFSALGMWIQTFEKDGPGSGTVHTTDGTDLLLPPALVTIAERSARSAWREQRVGVVSQENPRGLELSEAEGELVLAFLQDIGVGAILFVPLGAGQECLGNFVLTRAVHDPAWTEAEAATALDIGHDLGRAILNARTFEREHQLVQELQALDTYKSQLIATVAHELKNPLTSVLGHLEMVESAPEVPRTMATSLSAMERGANRMVRVIDDLLLLSKVGDPDNPVIPAPVDLRQIIDDVVDLTAVTARQKGLDVRLRVPDAPVFALGDAGELDRVCANLVSNAVKYTPDGGAVTITLEHADDSVVVTVADEGLGISEADVSRLGTEFFRSSNPRAVALPGTGLGLAIVRRIVDRHAGLLEIRSELGGGSTFRVRLPAASA
jgi:signal transduction histidine kinase